jgi:predicted dehydrogenase
MPESNALPASSSANRRDFLKRSSVAAASAAFVSSLSITRSAHAAGSDTLKVGLVGCGGRGTGAAAQALKADANTQLVALGDAFEDRLESSYGNLKEDAEFGARVDVPKERRFVGFDAYKQVIDSGIDVVLLCGPPGFRPAHIAYAIEKNKHVFAEKPVAVDAPGVRSVMATVEKALSKNLAVVSGLCYRYDFSKRETIQRIHDGAIGDITSLHVSYNTGTTWHRGRKPEWSEMEFQMRNWPYFTWLSGDFNVEQHVHSLDKAAWVMRDKPPIKATGLGGRQVRVEEQFGNVFDHMAVVYEYEDGVKLFSNCRQMAGCSQEVSDFVYGTKGKAELQAAKIEQPRRRTWRYRGKHPNMWEQEHVELFESLRSGYPINDGDYMCKSTMLAIMGRMACYTGRTLTWEECFNSKQDLSPASLAWGPNETPAVAKPGVTEFV